MEKTNLKYGGIVLNQPNDTVFIWGNDASNKEYQINIPFKEFKEIIDWANKKFKEIHEARTVCQGIGE